MSASASPRADRAPEAPRRPRARLVVISGASGVGKTSVAARLLTDPRFGRVVTATTRASRQGEVDGRDYWFLDAKDFRERLARGEFLEHAEVHGHLYGTPRTGPDRILAQGRHCLLVVDVQGAENIRRAGVDALFVFLRAPNEEELRRRLEGRAQDGRDAIEVRLAASRREEREAGRYDLVVVNDSVEETAQRIAKAVGVDLASPGTP
jgi:guanylate kinase